MPGTRRFRFQISCQVQIVGLSFCLHFVLIVFLSKICNHINLTLHYSQASKSSFKTQHHQLHLVYIAAHNFHFIEESLEFKPKSIFKGYVKLPCGYEQWANYETFGVLECGGVLLQSSLHFSCFLIVFSFSCFFGSLQAGYFLRCAKNYGCYHRRFSLTGSGRSWSALMGLFCVASSVFFLVCFLWL